ncbi:CRISPR-associated ring nuclease Csm6 [Desulfatitalea tepidiphila]|uniref:CRISPR-associated ring nuclease Csm6 n=1 Tax=Desulfatitalea tepidiphila TaxID=1185843 RepID=UPI0006B62015|nr:CRISPR-associated ring nuclease Csm6 [Desulfatitalea tepidiphila]
MKNILLAVVGLSPQVVTETLYALHQMNRPVHTIHLITTRAGEEMVLAQLLGGGKGAFYRFLKAYGPPSHGIDFGPGHIHVVRDDLGAEVDDIENEYDNAALLETCMRLTFDFTRDPDIAVFFSIAGGRKTMGACLTLAAQMYARPQDRLYHVLVSPEFESNRGFFFPPAQPETIELKNKRGETYFKSTSYAKVNLIHMPFISIRPQLAPEVLDQPRDPATLMLSLIRETPEQLLVHLKDGKLRYRGMEMDMAPGRLALYAFFALLKKECPAPEQKCKACDQCFVDHEGVSRRQPEITRLYKQMCGTRPTGEMSTTGILNLNLDNFKSLKSHIKRNLLQGFGPLAAEKLEIASVGKKPYTRYGLLIDKAVIELVM